MRDEVFDFVGTDGPGLAPELGAAPSPVHRHHVGLVLVADVDLHLQGRMLEQAECPQERLHPHVLDALLCALDEHDLLPVGPERQFAAEVAHGDRVTFGAARAARENERLLHHAARRPMMFLRQSVGLALVFLLTGCSYLHPWATDRDIEGSYDRVFRATLEILEAREFPIEQVNRDDGRIVTGKRPVRVIEGRRRVEKARARIEPDGGEVDVRLFLTFMDQSGTVQRRRPDRKRKDAAAIVDKALSSSAIYDEYLDAIEKRVDGPRRED